jgi:hypothetical protein
VAWLSDLLSSLSSLSLSSSSSEDSSSTRFEPTATRGGGGGSFPIGFAYGGGGMNFFSPFVFISGVTTISGVAIEVWLPSPLPSLFCFLY